MGPACQPLLHMSVLHYLLGSIYVVVLSQFDLRAQNLWFPLYIAAPSPLPKDILETLIHISHSDQHTPGGLGLELSNVVE
jgi:predicted alternative tryptophan synthase beta-subunit